MKILHLGCGSTKLKGAVGLDIDPKSQADIIHDMESYPYPVKESSFDEVFAEHVIEHMDNIPKVMEEIHRILKNGGKLIIRGPHFSSVDMFTDPTHRHFMTSRTFDYFVKGTHFFDWHYANSQFRKKKVLLGPPNLSNPFLKLILLWINRHQVFYERRLAFIFPVGVIEYELEAVK
jgi:SAM-dependent methyltransferase